MIKEVDLALSDKKRTALAEIVRRIVRDGGAGKGDSLWLHGSRRCRAAQRDMDFLIIKSTPDKRELSTSIRRAMYGVGVSIDLVVASPEDVERYKDTHCMVIKPALKDGVVVYDNCLSAFRLMILGSG